MTTRTKLILFLIATLIIGTGVVGFQLSHSPAPKPVTTTNTNATFASVDFYSADIPLQTRAAIKEWLIANSGVSGLGNTTVTVRKGSYSKTYSSDHSLATINFLVDLTGTPHVTYAVHIELSKAGDYAPLAITCPPANEQIGQPSACKGETQI